MVNVFQNVVSFSNVISYKCDIFFMNLVEYNAYLASTVDTDGLVLEHQAISSYSAEY